jgi:hypothetical protein
MHGPRYRVEFRGDLNEESMAAIAVLQERWPAAFPKDSDLIRPLVGRLVAPIAASTGWSKRYTAGVLSVWKRREAYSQAVLRYEHLYDLSGAATDKTVSEQARARAGERLAQRGHEKPEQAESARANP